MSPKPDVLEPNASSNDEAAQTVSAYWNGPLPPPAVLEDFDRVVPGGAERIFAAWEGETAHRHALEKRNLLLSAVDTILGKVFAFLFVCGALGACIYTAAIGANWVAAILGSGTIASVVWAFVKQRERDD